MGLPDDYADVNDCPKFGWLLQFVVAADQLLAVNDKVDEHIRLLEYGKRRGKIFLSGPNCTSTPFFGLLQTPTMCGLVKEYDVESGIASLRAIAEKIGLDGRDAVICYAHNSGYSYEYQSADYF
jgi:hypothetical protein